MMKRKISILTLTVLFFASTTGLPITVHLCEMMKTAEAGQCPMHKPIASCCDESNDSKVFFSSSIPVCCEMKTIDNSIVDKYLSQKTEFKSDFTSNPLILNSDLFIYESFANKYLGYTDTSPPSLNNNHLYLTFSSLLI